MNRLPSCACAAHNGMRAHGWLHPNVLTTLLLLTGLALTLMLWRAAGDQATRALQAEFDYQVRDTSTRVQRRIATYEQVLRGVQGFFAASGEVSREEFRRYFDALELSANYPGIQGVGYALMVPRGRVDAHVEEIRAQGLADYRLHPEGEREAYTAIVQIEPQAGRNLRALGYDMYSEPVRRAAMEAARDSGRTAISGRVRLLQEDEQGVQAGFMMYLPLYRKGAPAGNPAERRAAIFGWVYEPFRMDDLMAGLGDERGQELELSIFDGADSMFAAPGVAGHRPQFTAETRIELAGRAWRLVMRSLPAFEARLDKSAPRIVAATGVALSLALALLARLLAGGRLRAVDLAQHITDELRSSESRYRSLFENLPVGLARCRMIYADGVADDFVYLEVNPAFAALTGWESVTGRKLSELLPGVRREAATALAAYGRVASGGPTESFETYLPSLGRWYGVIAYMSAPGEFVAVFDDISERKRTEVRLRESEQRWKFALEGAGDGVWDWNVELDTLTLSARWKEILGYAPDELGDHFDEWAGRLHPDDRERVLVANRACIDGETEIYRSEYRLRSRDGSWKWISARGMVVARGPAGEALRMVGTNRDISDLKAAELALRESEERFRLAFLHAPVGLAILAPDGTILSANPALTGMLGYAAGASVGRNYREFGTPEDIEREEKLMRQLLAGEIASYSLERGALHRDAHIVDIRKTVSAVLDAERRPLSLVAQIEDITARKKAVSADLAMGILAAQEAERARLSHELHDEVGQSLTALKIALRHAQQQLDGERAGELLRPAKDIVDHLMGDIRGIAHRLRPTELDQLGLVAALRSHLDKMARPAGLAVRLVENLGDARLPGRLELCCFRITQEALTNCYRHAHAGEVVVTLQRGPQGLALSIRDDGVGFDVAHDDAAALPPGSLGLIGMRERVTAAGGRMSVLSRPGAGTEIQAFFAGAGGGAT